MIKESQEETVAGKTILDASSKGLSLYLIKKILAKTLMSANTASTGYFDRGSARTKAQMSLLDIAYPYC